MREDEDAVYRKDSENCPYIPRVTFWQIFGTEIVGTKAFPENPTSTANPTLMSSGKYQDPS